ncbi:MAG: BatA domain-containing protein [Planctomycetota bacterium]
MLNFVNPLFAWLGLAAIIPLIIHILNRRRYQKIRWAAMDFLLKALHKNRRRLQIENLILLILRMLIIVIFAFVLAKPYLKSSANLAQSDTHFIIAIDNSYSMGYRTGFSNLLDEAKRVSLGLIESLRPEKGDKLSLMTISDRPEILISESSFQMEQAKKKLANLTVSDYATDISKTFLLVKDILSKSVSSRKILYLITDNQRIAWNGIRDNETKEALQELIKTCKIKVIQIGDSNNNNVISRIYTDTAVITAKKPVTFYAEIHNYSYNTSFNEARPVRDGSQNSPTDTASVTKDLKVSFLVQGQIYTSSNVTISQNKSVLVPFIYTFNDPGQYRIKIELESDNLILDDDRLYAVSVREGINTLIINGKPSAEPSDDEIIFLRYALTPLAEAKFNSNGVQSNEDVHFSISPYLIDVLTVSQWLNSEEINSDKYTLIIMANVEMISPDRLKNMENFVKNGGGLLIFLGDQVDRTNYNRMLYKEGTGLLPYSLGEIKGDKTHNETIRFGEIEFAHPAFSFFSSLKERFNALSIYQYYELLPSPNADKNPPDLSGQTGVQPVPIDIGTTVLARLALVDKPPLIAEKSYGRGKTIVIATSADTEWNLMPVKPMYVMLIDQIALYLSTFTDKMNARNIFVKEPIELLLNKQSQINNYSLKLPKKGTISLLPTSMKKDDSNSYSNSLSVGKKDDDINPDEKIQDNDESRQFRLFYDNTEDAGLYTLSGDNKEFDSDNIHYFAVNPDSREGDLRCISLEELKQFIPTIQFDSIDGNKTMFPAADDTANLQDIPISHFWKYLLYSLIASVVLEMFLAWQFGRR